VEVCGVSAGGDILFIGRPLDGTDWDVYLEDPRNPMQSLAQLHLPSGAIATSSIMKRSWIQGERVRHHLVDPRTGEPANADWLSATVIGDSVIDAEVYAKAILIAGKQGLPDLLRARPELTFITVDADGGLSGSSRYKEYLYEFTSEPF
jgi:thiamine biosynthesis lipoprotein